jgi:hypothetical protein
MDSESAKRDPSASRYRGISYPRNAGGTGEGCGEMNLLTDLNSTLTPGSRYLLFFDLPPMQVDTLRKLASSADMLLMYEQRYGAHGDIELLGTTVQENYDGNGANQLIALIRVQGTPLLAAVGPIVAIALIVAGVYLVINFKHAIEVLAQSVSNAVTEVGTGAQQVLQDVGAGVKSLTEQTGTGLKYGLPILGVGLAALGIIFFTSYLHAE